MSAPELINTSGQQPDPSLIAGRYRLQERIGRGRLGAIFSAHDKGKESRGAGQRVAVQVVSNIVVNNNTLFNKLKTGYALLRATAHPNIVTYQSLFRERGRVYLVMELLDGAPLGTLLDDTGALEFDEVLPVLRGVSEALQLLHDNGLFHGNLTAQNVFLTTGLGVRLLDVVPLDSANAIFGGAETSGRATAEDDLFALACLAYEMLAGNPAFTNDGPDPAAPARVAELDDRQWNTLYRVLTRDSEKAVRSVADFMREFDSPASEPRSATNERALRTEPLRSPVAAVSEPVTLYPELTSHEPTIDTVTDAPRIDDWPDSEPNPIGRWPDHEADPAGPGPLRSVLLGVLLAVLGGWYYYGQPGQQVADLVAYAEQSMAPAAPTQAVEELVVEPISAAASVDESAPSPEDASAETSGSEPAQPEAAEAGQGDITLPEVGPPEDQSDIAIAVAESTDAQASEEPATTDEPEYGPPEQPAEEATPEQPKLVLADEVVSVSERSGVAKVWLRRNGEAKLPLVWWTSDSTARAENDYVAMPEQVVNAGPGEMLHIPLVDDNVPEQRESFYVDIGIRDRQGQIERIATVRVDIDDDDLP